MTDTDHRTRPHRHTRATTTLRADPEVWATALELADGDTHRLEVLDGGRTVAILNAPRSSSTG